jgi:4'-phosphopantetheinyl transferase
MSATIPPPERGPRAAVTRWQRGPLRPRLGGGEVHVWRARLSQLDDLRKLLSVDEREREARILGERDRLLWASSRGALRQLLARYLDADPTDVVLTIEPDGKPRLKHEPLDARELHFNLSHSGELALYAFANDGPVGVDVELTQDTKQSRRRDHLALARRVFGEREGQRLQAFEPDAREREFLRLWTRYEAALKRAGHGIGAGAAGIVEETAWIVELEIDTPGAAALAADRASALRLCSFA